MAQFPGVHKSKFTENLEFMRPDVYNGIPIYRVMNSEGDVRREDHDPQVEYTIWWSFAPSRSHSQ